VCKVAHAPKRNPLSNLHNSSQFVRVGDIITRANFGDDRRGGGVNFALICLERGADLHMAQLMPLPLTVSCFSKIQIGYYRAMLCIRGTSHGPVSVCLCLSVSVSVSVTSRCSTKT